MRKLNRTISAFLTVCMLLGALVGVMPITASGAEVSTTDKPADLSAIDYTTQKYYTAEQKLGSMNMWFESGDYQLWVNDYTGEVATVNTKTGEKLFTNPYDIGLSSSAKSVKYEVLSQIIIAYSEAQSTSVLTMNSYYDCVLNGQIVVKNIKNGVRVEYTIGREETNYLVPRLITVDRFESVVKALIDEAYYNGELGATEQYNEFIYKKINSYFVKYDPDDPEYASSPAKLEALYTHLPIVKKVGPVYEIDASISSQDLLWLEGYIKTCCPNYSYDELNYDHDLTEYVNKDANPAVFKLALEYTLDDLGMVVSLPANGIRFDESLYQLSSVTILPYMGAGSYRSTIETDKILPNTGYTFLPDGSGAIFRFEDLATSGATIGGKIYGQDYAYHQISGRSQETFRMPVYGTVVNNAYEYEYDSAFDTYTAKKNENPTSSGFLAIIEEGDALSEVRSHHQGLKGEYHAVQLVVTPRPYDSYNIADSISVGNSSTWTVVSERKYLGNYKVRYIMLTDESVAAESGMDEFYSADYFGMAMAYQDYLTSPYSTGTQNESKENQTTVLKRLDDGSVQSSIPLYIETFGTMETVEKVLSIPVNVMTPLTTFEDVKQIYTDLESVGITNINFKLTGYANGGMEATIPYKLKWEKAVGGKNGFEDLLEFASEVGAEDGKNLGIFPDFDFEYVSNFDSFDGFSLKKYAVKTIDNRYTAKRIYDATYQTYTLTNGLAVSPAYFSRFYNKLAEKYLKYSADNSGNDLGISVSTLGTELNSDFDEDEPYNREDSMTFTSAAVKALSETYGNVMTEGGNAYTWQYVDYILNMPIDSSRYLSSSNAIPFTGIVLHGYVQYSGSPINMEGNIQYGILKAIESGSSLYFILTYNNATKLKENPSFSKYFSVRYDIWAGSYDEDGVFVAGELVDIYNKLNDVTKDLQTKRIIGHELLSGIRIPEEAELEADRLALEAAEQAAAEKAAADALAKFHAGLVESRTTALTTIVNTYTTASARLSRFNVTSYIGSIEGLVKDIRALEANIASTTDETLIETYRSDIEIKENAILGLYKNTVMSAYNDIKKANTTINEKVELINSSYEYFVNSGEYSEQFLADVKAIVDEVQHYVDDIAEVFNTMEEYLADVIEAADGVIVPESNEPDQTVEKPLIDTTSKYNINKGSVVAVTYGEEDAPYRTFILNYNYYKVSIEYNGQTYELDSYGFVTIDHKN